MSLAPEEFAPAGVFLNSATLGLAPRRSVEAMRAFEDARAAGEVDARVRRRVRRARPRRVRRDDRPVPRRRGDRQPDLPVRRARRRLAPGRCGRARRRGGLHLGAVPLPAHARARRTPRAPGPAARRRHRRGRPGRRLGGAVGRRPGPRPRRARRRPPPGTAPARSSTSPRRPAGSRSRAWSPTTWSASGYKWLLGPRGTCFFAVGPDLRDEVPPLAAGWYAGGSRWDSIYGPPLRLARGRAPLRPLAGLGLLGGARARRWTCCSRSASTASTPTTWPWPTRSATASGCRPATRRSSRCRARPTCPSALAAAGIRAAVRAGRLRLSFHLLQRRLRRRGGPAGPRLKIVLGR